MIVEVEPDITAQELNALIADLASRRGCREGGATIVLPSSRAQPNGRYSFTESITLRQHIILAGEGPGTLLARDLTAPFTGEAILTNAHPADRRFGARNLAIDATNVTYGIHLTTHEAPGNEYDDGIYTIENVEIFDPDRDGVWLEGRGQAIVRGIRVRDARRHGYVIDSVDSVFDALEAGGCHAAGMVVRGSNNRFANCKSFWSGVEHSNDGHGIWLDGSRGGQNAVFINCETQDSNHHGVFIQDFHKVWMQNHLSEGNNAGNNGAADQHGNAYHVHASSDVKIRGTAVGRTANAHQQQYAIGMEEGAENLRAELISEKNEAGHILNGWHWATDIRINNYDGNQRVPYAPAYRPDPTLGRKILLGPLSGTITILNPLATTSAVGQELELAILQNAKEINWGSEFRLGDFSPTRATNVVDVYTFRRHPNAWILVAGMAHVDATGLE